jgi:hypothetical protein
MEEERIDNFPLCWFESINECWYTPEIIADGMERKTVCDECFVTDSLLCIIECILNIGP